jgi:hypothetical protein
MHSCDEIENNEFDNNHKNKHQEFAIAFAFDKVRGLSVQ